MSERKVLNKYYPPDFDPAALTRKRGPKAVGPKVQPVRFMTPFSMRCTTCGNFIYKGRRFNAKKETPMDARYLGIQIFFFHIKCTSCSSSITFRTDPKNSDYAMVKGAIRNSEPWRNREAENETEEERLDRLEREEAAAAGEEGEQDAMADLEAKNQDARREMAAADALDAIRQRNARIQLAAKNGVDLGAAVVEEREVNEKEDEEEARRVFAAARARAASEFLGSSSTSTPNEVLSTQSDVSDASAMPPPTFRRVVKKKKDHAVLLGIKKRKPGLV